MGANIGYYSCLFGKMAHAGKVVAYEPTHTSRLLEQNLSANQVSNVEISQCALGVAEGNLQESIFRIWGKAPEVKVYKFSTVDLEMKRLEWDRLDLLKIDVDSFDFEVLQGSGWTLDKFNPWVLVELNHALAKRNQGVNEALNWLALKGYQEALILDDENFLLRHSGRERPLSQAGIRLEFDREPVYLVRTLRRMEGSGGVVAENPKVCEFGEWSDFRKLRVFGKAWNYAAMFMVSRQKTGFAIVTLDVEVEGSDVGVVCVDRSHSKLVGEEVFVAPGSKAEVVIEIEHIEEVAAIVIRKGPENSGEAMVTCGTPLVSNATFDLKPNLPLTHDVSVKSVALERMAEGIISRGQWADLPDESLEVVDSHMLGERLGLGGSFRAPLRVIDIPLKDFRMETHDALILEQVYRAFRPGKHLEFGTWEGFGATLCAKSCDAKIWTLNLPEGERDAKGNFVYTDCSTGAATDADARIGHLYREAGFSDRVEQLLVDSLEFDDSAFAPGFFDSVLVDGGHTHEVVTSDTDKAMRLLRTGGLLI